jgi:hypothetical protein
MAFRKDRRWCFGKSCSESLTLGLVFLYHKVMPYLSPPPRSSGSKEQRYVSDDMWFKLGQGAVPEGDFSEYTFSVCLYLFHKWACDYKVQILGLGCSSVEEHLPSMWQTLVVPLKTKIKNQTANSIPLQLPLGLRDVPLPYIAPSSCLLPLPCPTFCFKGSSKPLCIVYKPHSARDLEAPSQRQQVQLGKLSCFSPVTSTSLQGRVVGGWWPCSCFLSSPV